MLSYVKSAALLLALGASQVAAQGDLLTMPEVLHEFILAPELDVEAGVASGNGIVITPDSSSIIVTSVGATVTSLTLKDLEYEWEYNPPQLASGVVRSHSRVVFAEMAETPYMAYTVVINENSLTPVSRVIALDMEGEEMWTSDDLEGIVTGDPVISEDGAYVFVTHNIDTSVGVFTQLSAAMNGTIYFSSTNPDYAFSAPGIYHSPAEGNYDDPTNLARSNTNDIILFAAAPYDGEQPIEVGNTFAFQMPMEYDGNVSTLELLTMGEGKDFKSYAAPAIVNDGYSAYFAASRSQFWCWVNEDPDLGTGRFNRGRQGRNQATRNDEFAGTPSFATPAVSSGAQPSVFGGSAFTEFVQMDYLVNIVNIVPTVDYVMTEAVIDPFERSVYYMEATGLLHSVDFTDITTENWAFSLGVRVSGEMAVIHNGYAIFYADESGRVVSLKVTEFPDTPSPTATPSMAPSMAPTAPTPAPTNSTESPTMAPTMEPTMEPTASPVAGDTPAPTAAPTASPTAPDSSAASNSVVLVVASLAAFMLF
eukprot:Nitzschia sp. Nitz4//scaffold8_size234185//210384//212064//NITZ4_001299-RA/size234185-snap-gene-0.26-mRNA-1//1//CDS//3329559932//8827//frame0